MKAFDEFYDDYGYPKGQDIERISEDSWKAALEWIKSKAVSLEIKDPYSTILLINKELDDSNTKS